MEYTNYERDFKGVWIPKEVWLDARLNMLEKGILAEIDSLDNGERGCWASNKHIAEFCQCSEKKVSTAVSKFIKLGYLYVQKFDGRQRELKSNLSNLARQPRKICEAEQKKSKESNTPNNTPNKKKERKKTSYDEILSAVKDDSLRELYYEYIKMRNLIKAPMTDRALKMLITEVNKLEPDNISKQKQILEKSILHNYKSVYPLNNKQNNSSTGKKENNGGNSVKNDTYNEYGLRKNPGF